MFSWAGTSVISLEPALCVSSVSCGTAWTACL